MQRRPSTQDITWLLGLHTNEQLDLNLGIRRDHACTIKRVPVFSGH
jgi:hypothetical protein